MAIPEFAFKEALMLTAASGALVPIATIVRPITNWGIPIFPAIPADPSTNQSAPFTNIIKPTANNNICTSIIHFLLSLLKKLIEY